MNIIKNKFLDIGFVLESENLMSPPHLERGAILEYPLFAFSYNSSLKASVLYKGFLDNGVPDVSYKIVLSLRGYTETHYIRPYNLDSIKQIVNTLWEEGNKDFYR
jgi:hypothetical protein